MVSRVTMSMFNETGNYAVVIDYNKAGPRWDVPHTHWDFDELVFVHTGSGIHVVDGEVYPLMRGDVFVLRGTHRHTFKFQRNLQLVNILYRRIRFAAIMPELALLPGFNKLFIDEPGRNARMRFAAQFRLTVRQMDEINATIQDINREFSDVPYRSDFILECLFKSLVARICRFYVQAESVPLRADARIGLAISHIEQHFAEEVTVADLARVAAMTPATLLFAFKKATGCSPIDYLIHLRVARAAEKLALQDVRVIDAAMSCGFNNSSYFTRKFKEVMAITPRQYVQKHRG